MGKTPAKIEAVNQEHNLSMRRTAGAGSQLNVSVNPPPPLISTLWHVSDSTTDMLIINVSST